MARTACELLIRNKNSKSSSDLYIPSYKKKIALMCSARKEILLQQAK